MAKEFLVQTNVTFGQDSINTISEILKGFGAKNVMVVYDKGTEDEDKYALSKELLRMVKEMGIKPLHEQGRERKITEADFEVIANDALKEGPLHFNPRQDVTKEVIIDILKKAF